VTNIKGDAQEPKIRLQKQAHWKISSYFNSKDHSVLQYTYHAIPHLSPVIRLLKVFAFSLCITSGQFISAVPATSPGQRHFYLSGAPVRDF